MKQLFTLLLCTGFASGAFAQSDRGRAADVILRGGGRPASTSTTTSGSGNHCQDQIDALNRTYDAQIAAIRADGRFSQADRDYKIRQTEDARRYKIDQVRRNCDGDYDNTNTGAGHKKGKNKVKGNKGNNGNHYGWEKGKGNPHRNGGKMKGKDD